MDNVLKRPEYSKMYEVLRGKVGKSLFKSVITMFVLTLIKTFILCLGFMPLLNAVLDSVLKSGEANLLLSDFSIFFKHLEKVFSINLMIKTLFLSFFLRIVVELLNFGATNYFTNLSLNKKTKFSDLFAGFLSYSYKSWFIALFNTILFFIPLFIVLCITFLVPEEYYASWSTKKIMLIVLGIYFALFLIFYLVKIFFVFLKNIIIQYKSINILSAFKLNFKLIFRKMFHFIGFCFYVSWKNILVYVLATVILYLIPDKVFVAISFIMFFFNFVLWINEYMILVKFNISLPIYYYSLLAVNNMINNNVDFYVNLNAKSENKVNLFVDNDSEIDSDSE